MSKQNENINHEIEDFVTMINFFKVNAENITALSTMSFLQATMEFSEKIKPIYVKELLRLEGGK